MLLYEFKADLNAYLAALGARTPLPDAEGPDPLQRGEPRRARCPTSARRSSRRREAKGPLTEKDYVDALAKDLRLSRKEGIDKTMDEHKLDALVAPTSGPATLIDLVNGDYGVGRQLVASRPSPAIRTSRCPAGYDFGLPVGISFFGRAWSEPTLLQDRLRLRAGHQAAQAADVSGRRRT